MKYYLHICKNLKGIHKKDPSMTAIFDEIVPKILQIWKRASIPVVSQKRIRDMIKSFHTKFRTTLKSERKPNFESKLKPFRIMTKKLFDIASCKYRSFEQCVCSKISKVRQCERTFLEDERTNRKMFIGVLDQAKTKKLLQKQARKSSETLRNLSTNIVNECIDRIDERKSLKIQVPTQLVAPVLNPNLDKLGTSQMRIKLPSLASACDRANVSDRGAAIIASAVLQDIGVVTESYKTKVIDRMKIRRERKNNRDEFNLSLEKNDETVLCSLNQTSKRKTIRWHHSCTVCSRYC